MGFVMPLEPPIAIQAYELKAQDSEFSQECRKKVLSLYQFGSFQIYSEVLTTSDKWGLVWRADVSKLEHNNKDTDKVICWRSGETISILLKIKPWRCQPEAQHS
jgi:hypothetical protein